MLIYVKVITLLVLLTLTSTEAHAAWFSLWGKGGNALCKNYFVEAESRERKRLFQPLSLDQYPTLSASEVPSDLHGIFELLRQGVEPQLQDPASANLYYLFAYSEFSGLKSPPSEARPSTTYERLPLSRVKIIPQRPLPPVPETLQTLSNHWIQTLSHLRSQFTEIETHLDYWAFITDLTPTLRKDINEQEHHELLRQFNRHIDAETRSQIRNTNLSPQKRSQLLLQSLLKIQKNLQQRGEILDFIHEAILNALTASTFLEPHILEGLQSPNTFIRVKTIKNFFRERDALTRTFHFGDGFNEAVQQFPTREQVLLTEESATLEKLNTLDLNELKASHAPEYYIFRPLNAAETIYQQYLTSAPISPNMPANFYFTVTDSWGRTSGLIQAYVKNDKFNTRAEYEHMGLPEEVIPFLPSAVSGALPFIHAFIGRTPIRTSNMSADVLKLDPIARKKLPILGDKAEKLLEGFEKQVKTLSFLTEQDRVLFLKTTSYFLNKKLVTVEKLNLVLEQWIQDPKSSDEVKVWALTARLETDDTLNKYRMPESLKSILKSLSPEVSRQVYAKLENREFHSHIQLLLLARFLKPGDSPHLHPLQTSNFVQSYIYLQKEGIKNPALSELFSRRISENTYALIAPYIARLIRNADTPFIENLKSELRNINTAESVRAEIASWWFDEANGEIFWSPAGFRKFLLDHMETQDIENMLPSKSRVYSNYIIELKSPKTQNYYSCFTRGTRIQTPHSEIEIQNIRVGDIVLAFDAKTQQTVPRTVRNIFSHQDRPLLQVRIEGGTALNVTPEHPFYSFALKKYIPISQMNVGERVLFNYKGSLMPVRIQSIRSLPQKETVYNFEVDELNNYFAEGVLVHNMKEG